LLPRNLQSPTKEPFSVRLIAHPTFLPFKYVLVVILAYTHLLTYKR